MIIKFEFTLSNIVHLLVLPSKLQLENIKVIVATSKEIEFEDVNEGSYVVEVGQFKGEETSPLDVRVNYFDEQTFNSTDI